MIPDIVAFLSPHCAFNVRSRSVVYLVQGLCVAVLATEFFGNR